MSKLNYNSTSLILNSTYKVQIKVFPSVNHFQDLPKSPFFSPKYDLTSPGTGCLLFINDETALKLATRLHGPCKLTLTIYTAV